MEKRIKKAIENSLQQKVETENKGIMSLYHMNASNIRILYENKIKIDWEKSIIYKSDKPYAKIIKRYSAKKTGGCYKTLKPKIEEL